MRLLALFLILALQGCSGMTVYVHWIPTHTELLDKCGWDYMEGLDGCARGGVMSVPDGDCTIYILSDGAPSFDEHRTLQALGHELLHCLRGREHI